jgi:hypothetical protein
MTAAPQTSFAFDLGRAAAGDLAVVGVVVVMTGSLEATMVRDGQFTAVLKRAGSSERIELSFPEALTSRVLDNLCRRVAAEGCLRNDSSADRSLLELHKLTPLPDDSADEP